MICRQCLRAVRRSSPAELATAPNVRTWLSPRAQSRYLSASSSSAATVSTNAATSSAPRQGSPSSSHNPPAATSTSAAQPFSEGLTPSAKNQDLPISPPKASASPPTVQSSVPAGTPLKGLNFIKGKQDPVAKEDSEYPAWLWTILGEHDSSKKSAGTDVDETDLFAKSAKARRRAAKALRKQQLLNPESLAPKIPLHEQSIDLPSGDVHGSYDANVDAGDARGTLTKSMRSMRRAKIKEGNFLKAMG